MASTNPVGTQLVIDGCLQWPHLPSRTLARILVRDNKGVWASVNTCRMSVLRHRGRVTDTRKRAIKKLLPSTCPNVPHNPDAFLPKSDESSFLPLVIDVAKDTRGLIVSDVHIPYHNTPAVKASLERGKREEVDLVILNGDTLDFHRLSRFQKDPRARDAAEELKRGNHFLDAIDDMFPKARKIYKAGNHDERYDSYLAAHAEELFKVVKEFASLEKLLELEDRGWEYVSEKRPIYTGSLTICHGHEWPTPVLGPVNAARGLFLRTKASAIVGHHHQTSEHTEPTVRGKMITTWSTGCLCELHPQYARFNKWNHGAATVELSRGGDFRVHNFRIHDGQMMN